MYKGLRVVGITPVLDEAVKIGQVLDRIPHDVVDEMVVIDDGCTDSSPQVARDRGATVIPMGRTVGVGAALRVGYQYAVEQSFDVAVVMAGNNKDAPEEIPLLLEPIECGRADFVQGSRWLSGEHNFGPMPAYRKVATRLHPMLFSLVARHKVTDSTNGFRAIRVDVLRDPRLDLTPEWLDAYELEPFLYLSVIGLGYPVAEVPVTKVYPPKAQGQTKMKPFVDWWSILRPLARAAVHPPGRNARAVS